ALVTLARIFIVAGYRRRATLTIRHSKLRFGVKNGRPVIRYTDKAARIHPPEVASRCTPAQANVKTLGWRSLRHGEARLRIEPVARRLRGSSGNAARTRALSSFHRARARPDRHGVRPPHVRGDALWDEDLADWDAQDRDYAAVWRGQPKWVVSGSLKSVG